MHWPSKRKSKEGMFANKDKSKKVKERERSTELSMYVW